jgi:hypothetical protein
VFRTEDRVEVELEQRGRLRTLLVTVR